MASHVRIQKPYELTSLPKSLDQSGDAYSVGEVFGQSRTKIPKKRKRSELAIGINGEALNIYDIASSRLVTSYPVPPQATFTCPPYSLRCKGTDKHITRYTYTSTLEPKPRITLYKDSLGASGATASSTTCHHQLHRSQRVVHLGSIAAPNSASAQPEPISAAAHLVAVTEAGAVICLDGESLGLQWQNAPDLLKQDTRLTASNSLHIDHVHAASLADVIRGVFGGKDDLAQTFSLKASDGGNGPDVLILISRSQSDGRDARHVHIVAPSSPTGTDGSGSHGIVQLFVAPLPSPFSAFTEPPSYRVDVSSGSLLELRGERLAVYDISSPFPRLESELYISGATSFLRLSRSSLITATESELAIYNPLYRSLQVSLPLEHTSKNAGPFRLVAHFARLELVVGVAGNSLIAVQLEVPKTRNKKRRPEGLLIDAVGRGVITTVTKRHKPSLDYTAKTFSTFAPQSLESDSWIDGARKAENLMKSGKFLDFERFMARAFGLSLKSGMANGVAGNGEPETNGVEHSSESEMEDCEPKTDPPTSPESRKVVGEDGEAYWIVNGLRLPPWQFPEQIEQADRRLVTYAIQKVLTITSVGDSNHLGWKLHCRIPWSGTLQYLAMAGHLTLSNIRAAIGAESRDADISEEALGEQLPLVLAEVDPTLDLLLTWLSSTRLGSTELLSAVKLIMRSLELIQDPKRMTKNLLTLHQPTVVESGTEENGEIGMELDLLEEELHLTEHYLGDESGNRAHGLSVAFGKLDGCPTVSNVRAIRQIFKPEETLSLIYLLRIELNRDGWTRRYLDSSRLAEEESDELEAPPDSSIRLIADLLCQCIDAVGPAGWLLNDILYLTAGPASDRLDSADFLNSMKAEISAALEGVEEAVYLRGILTEVVRYGASFPQTIQKVASTPGASSKALTTTQPQQAATRLSAGAAAELPSMLPLGSKVAKSAVSKRKVVSGGEIRQRTMREIGHLTSKKVADYSFERIVI